MENIKIYDHFLNKNELIKLLEVINHKEWNYGHSSGNNERFNNKFFAAYELGEFYTDYIKSKIENTVFKKFNIDRNYMHIQLYGQNGSYHIDNEKKNTFTFCIYLSSIDDDTMENSDGDFLLKIPNEKGIICINTLNNRGVFFPSTYLHKGMAYNHWFKEKRLCITWKLTEIITEDK
uniref:Prolyl 4-hydroxylase alpha subunit Fe(2+) 2OG dioxygenase domain-containing protein n=1 Tax=viral metagenome TaxID=1070528 RepID=A0A6C0I1D6_9ZZZZ